MTKIRELLTEAQLRHVESVLRYVERSLDETERDLQIQPNTGILCRTSSDLSPIERDHLRESIAKVRSVLATLAGCLALEREASDLRRSIVARFSILAIDARSIAGEELRGYGSVRRELAEGLDVYVDALVEALEEVLHCVGAGEQP